MIFCDLLWFFKNSAEINKKRQNHPLKPLEEVIWPILKVQGVEYPVL